VQLISLINQRDETMLKGIIRLLKAKVNFINYIRSVHKILYNLPFRWKRSYQ